MAVEKIILDIRAQVDKAAKDIKDLKAQVSGVNKEVNKSDQLFKKAAGTMAALFSVAAITGFVNKIIEVRAEFEKYEAVLANTLGSAKAAQIEFAKIQKFASETPFSVRELTNAFVKLANQGFKPSIEQMKRLGDLAASTGKSFDQLTEAIIDATVGEFERLKEFGIRAKKSGDTVKFTFKEVETQVKFTRSAIEDYIYSLGDLQGVEGAMSKISETLGGRISNLGDSWDSLLNTLGQRSSGIFFTVISGLNSLIQTIDNASLSIHQVREEVRLMALDAEQEASVDEFVSFLEVAKQEGETYLDVAQRFLEVDRMRLKLLPKVTEEGKKLLEALGVNDPQAQANLMLTKEEQIQKELLLIRIEAIEKFAREMDLKEQARLNKLLEAEYEAAKKTAAAWIKSFDDQIDAAEDMLENLIDIEDRKVEKAVESSNEVTRSNERQLRERDEAAQGNAETEVGWASWSNEQKLAFAENTMYQMSMMAKEGSATQKALQIAMATIDTYRAANAALSALSGIPLIGPALGIATAAVIVGLGLSNVANIAGISFSEGGFTGTASTGFRDRKGKRIAGMVHENEFVFDEEKTKQLRPFFEDIHEGRIDARELAKLTKRGIIVPIIKNEFNSKILEKEVGRIYRKMGEEKPQRYTERTPTGLRKIIGNTTININ